MTSLRSWATELRQFLRLKARSGVSVRMEGYEQMAVVLRDVSRGGFAMLAPAPFSPGDRYRFRFDLPSGKAINLRAVAVHGHPHKDANGPAEYVSGWRFLLENAAEDIDRLVAAAGEHPPTGTAS
jgi:hypothetical protein